MQSNLFSERVVWIWRHARRHMEHHLYRRGGKVWHRQTRTFVTLKATHESTVTSKVDLKIQNNITFVSGLHTFAAFWVTEI